MNKSVSFVGSGKIVRSLLPALIDAGYEIKIVVSNNSDQLKTISNNFKINVSDELKNLIESDFIFVAVPDSVIKTVALEISKLDIDFKNSTFVHFSGSKTCSEFSSLEEKNIQPASFHPMQTFPNYNKTELKNVYAAIETKNESVYKKLEQLAIDLEMKPFPITGEGKVNYHLMGVFIANFMGAAFYNADKINSENKNIPSSQELLSLIANQSLNNILEKGAVNSLSGPIERGDLETIKLHLKSLKRLPEILLYYVGNSISLCEIALEKGSISKSKCDEIKTLLKSYLK